MHHFPTTETGQGDQRKSFCIYCSDVFMRAAILLSEFCASFIFSISQPIHHPDDSSQFELSFPSTTVIVVCSLYIRCSRFPYTFWSNFRVYLFSLKTLIFHRFSFHTLLLYYALPIYQHNSTVSNVFSSFMRYRPFPTHASPSRWRRKNVRRKEGNGKKKWIKKLNELGLSTRIT